MKKPERAVWILAVFYFLLNLGFLSSQYNFDGTVFSLHLEAVKAGKSFGLLLHPRHLLYEPLGYFFWNLLGLIGFRVRAIFALQIFDLILSSLGLAIFALNLMLIQPKRKWSALLFALGLGSSYGWWFLSVEAEVYLLAVLILNLAFYYMLKTFSPARFFLSALGLGLFASLAIFGHLAYGLFLIPIIYYLLKISPAQGREKFYPALAMLFLTGMLSAGVYLLAFHYNPLAQSPAGSGLEKFIKWFFGLALPETSFGYRQSYWNLSLSAPGQWLSGIWICFWGRKDFGPGFPGISALRIFCLLVLVIGILVGIYFYCREWRKRPPAQDLIWLWLIPGSLFTIFWEPSNYEHKLYFLPALWMLVFLGFHQLQSIVSKKIILPTFVSAILLLSLINLETRIIPGAQPENNRQLNLALKVKELTPPGSVIIISGAIQGANFQKIYLPYFAGRNAMVLDWVLSKEIGGRKFPGNLEKIIQDDLSAGKPVYVLSEVWEGPVMEELSTHHRIKPEDLREFWNQFQLKPIFKTEGVIVYRII